jgi:hypothetical protein
MGHIRLGRLPKTRPWSSVIEVLRGDSISTPELARAIAVAAQHRFAALEGDRGINYCFWILAQVVTAARGNDFARELERLGVQSSGITSGLGFVQQLAQAIEGGVRERVQPTVFVRIAELSFREVLSANLIDQSQSLFGTGLAEIQAACRAMSTRRRFGQVAKEFFASFISRSIRYITDKELSNHVGANGALGSPQQVLEFQQALDRYCTESAKIVEDFAAGWFSKHNWESNNNISEESTLAFTAYALEKIQMELREGQV